MFPVGTILRGSWGTEYEVISYLEYKNKGGSTDYFKDRIYMLKIDYNLPCFDVISCLGNYRVIKYPTKLMRLIYE